MNTLPLITQRRIKKLPQIPSVWEGDRRVLAGTEAEAAQTGECIIWVDGSEGYVRAMDMVAADLGPEAVVRTLVRAIETPDSPAQPARPQKIVVCDREIQFFLRGVLQSLGINVDYVPQLPVINELFRRFEESFKPAPSAIAPQYKRLLEQVSQEIWNEAPWEMIADHDILAIELNDWDVQTIYACIMGRLGREHGIVLYRSLESLQRFRQAILAEESVQGLEKAFLSQDCWFLNFELKTREDLFDPRANYPHSPNLGSDEAARWGSPQEKSRTRSFDAALVKPDSASTSKLKMLPPPPPTWHPLIGSIHPYEGMRPLRDAEEASIVYAALKALSRFFQSSQSQLAQETIRSLSQCYCISVAPERAVAKTVLVTVSTMPELACELLEIDLTESEAELENLNTAIHEDLVPEDAFVSIGMMPWDLIETLRDRPKVDCQLREGVTGGEGMPMILIQTSRPKAKKLVEKIKVSGGLQGIGFHPGEDPVSEIAYDLGILLTGNGELSLFGEFIGDEPQHVNARQKWEQRCYQTGGCCGLIVAMGITGSSRGNPRLQDMLALFETQAIDAEELGIGFELNLV